MSKKTPSFLRADTVRHLRLGKKRKKLQKWRRPRGHHNKLRLKRFSYPVQPGIGYGSQKAEAGKIRALIPVLVHNHKELESMNSKTHAVILARVGAKKKIELLERAEKLQLNVLNASGKERSP